jgi:hypothetical protein
MPAVALRCSRFVDAGIEGPLPALQVRSEDA